MRTVGVLFAGAALCAHAQWVYYPTPGIPRTRDGKPNLSAPAPLAPNGKPDLSGTWQVQPTPAAELTRLFGDLSAEGALGDEATSLSKYGLNILADFKPEEAPIRPEAVAIQQSRRPNDIPTTRCLPGGMPFIYQLPIPFKIIQTPGLIAFLHEGDGSLRQIYTDGRKRPADPQPLWHGYSLGKWENSTLVVDTAGFNDKSWLDGFGHPHSEALHLVERFHRRDFGHLDVEVTVEDPKMYTKAFTIKYTELLLADSDITESYCAENERDRPHMATP